MSLSIDFLQDISRFSSTPVNVTSSGTLIAGIGGKTIRVYRVDLVVGGNQSGTIALGDTTPTTLFPTTPFLPYTNFKLDLDGEPYFTCASGKGFTVTLVTITALTGVIWYTQS